MPTQVGRSQCVAPDAFVRGLPRARFRQEQARPSRDVFKTNADVVKFVQQAVADGATVIQQHGDADLDRTAKFFGNRLAHSSYVGHRAQRRALRPARGLLSRK